MYVFIFICTWMLKQRLLNQFDFQQSGTIPWKTEWLLQPVIVNIENVLE